jgi:uncharacterized protein (DUF4415 family)
MKTEYDFSKGKRGAILSSNGKSRITIYLDNEILDAFKIKAEEEGTGYQTLINTVLKDFLKPKKKKILTESSLRRILKEEIPKISNAM